MKPSGGLSVTSDAEKYGDNAEREVCCDFLLVFEDAYDLTPLPLDCNRLPPLLPCSYSSPSFSPLPSLSSLPFFFLFDQNFTSSPLFFPPPPPVLYEAARNLSLTSQLFAGCFANYHYACTHRGHTHTHTAQHNTNVCRTAHSDSGVFVISGSVCTCAYVRVLYRCASVCVRSPLRRAATYTQMCL